MDLNNSLEDHGRYLRVSLYMGLMSLRNAHIVINFMPSVEPFKGNSKENGKEWKNPKTFFSVFELLI